MDQLTLWLSLCTHHTARLQQATADFVSRWPSPRCLHISLAWRSSVCFCCLVKLSTPRALTWSSNASMISASEALDGDGAARRFAWPLLLPRSFLGRGARVGLVAGPLLVSQTYSNCHFCCSSSWTSLSATRCPGSIGTYRRTVVSTAKVRIVRSS